MSELYGGITRDSLETERFRCSLCQPTWHKAKSGYPGIDLLREANRKSDKAQSLTDMGPDHGGLTGDAERGPWARRLAMQCIYYCIKY